jgi:DNA-binding NtrC family response regulator
MRWPMATTAGGTGPCCAIHPASDRDAALAATVCSNLAARSVRVYGRQRARDGPAPLTARLCVCVEPGDDLLELVAALAADGVRVLVIVGPAGCGTELVWRLMAGGAGDVVSWKCAQVDGRPLADPGAAVAARLTRWHEVERYLGSAVVKRQLVGRSAAWQAALRQVVEVAGFTGLSLLVLGESGTGKELIARLLHHLDPRTDKRDLIVVDCTTVVPTLSGSEFFGHEKGAFTGAGTARDGAFAAADHGTLFLDEVGELPPPLQAELLRVVQEGTYKRVGGDNWRSTNFRLVCATNRDLEAEVRAGRFRLDLYHRIAASRVVLPPLRDRRDDVLDLFHHFLGEVTGEADLSVDPAVAALLRRRDYPGNVRDLRQLALRIAARHVGPGPITPGDVPDEECTAGLHTLPGDPDREVTGLLEAAVRAALSDGRGYREIRDDAAETAVRLTVRMCGDDLQQAARRLGVTDRMLQKWRATTRSSASGTAAATGSDHAGHGDGSSGRTGVPRVRRDG